VRVHADERANSVVRAKCVLRMAEQAGALSSGPLRGRKGKRGGVRGDGACGREQWAEAGKRRKEKGPSSWPKLVREGKEGRADSWGWAKKEGREIFQNEFLSNSNFQI